MNAEPKTLHRQDTPRLEALRQIERKLLWLSAWMVHNANHVRPNRDGLKVGGHQASCASVVSIMTALYFDKLRPQDRVAVKPHASPVFHAAIFCSAARRWKKWPACATSAAPKPTPAESRTAPKSISPRGSVGLGVAITSFASLIQDYVRLHGLTGPEFQPGRHIAIAGDAELTKAISTKPCWKAGNTTSATSGGSSTTTAKAWTAWCRTACSAASRACSATWAGTWSASNTAACRKPPSLRPGGEALRSWIDDCPNSLYASLTFQGGEAWRAALLADLGRDTKLRAIVDTLTDAELARLMTNLGGHDIEAVLDALTQAEQAGDRPTCFIAYTIKGMGLPFAGHQDNHSGLMTAEQMDAFRTEMRIRPGHEWDAFEGLDLPPAILRDFIDTRPFAHALTPSGRAYASPQIPVPAQLPMPKLAGRKLSTQSGFGEILGEIGRAEGPWADTSLPAW